ncbi:MAG: Gfo/Idh/MocA family oxidoreductase [Saprospiraceae bacterium]|nr:Gfo/Idh/MocA family oxidoreductase [Saprospiraceae bacterium]
MAKKLRLGIVGISPGNGHPYSWAAIFNGFDSVEMAACPYPTIQQYLSAQKFPEDFLNHLATVDFVYTQDQTESEKIARSSRIPNVCNSIEEMIPNVDGILLARDDAESHYEMSLSFLRASLPVFIDKPLALNVEEGMKILNEQQRDNQIYTCSSLRFSKEILLSDEDKMKLGVIYSVEASCPKYWNTYAVHILEPIIAQSPERGDLKSIEVVHNKDQSQAKVEWENLSGVFMTTGSTPSPFLYRFYGDKGMVEKRFTESFQPFKHSLLEFINMISDPKFENIPREETLEIVRIISGK